MYDRALRSKLDRMTTDQSDLERFLVDLAADADADVERSAAGGTEFRRGRRMFAWASGRSAELLLHAEIAEAAARTPDTALSDRGTGWIRFTPPEMDSHALDRARAWFLSAWRAADKG